MLKFCLTVCYDLVNIIFLIAATKHGVHDTPSMPPRPYPTPRHSMKTPRKKLTLFSPASSTKKKRYLDNLYPRKRSYCTSEGLSLMRFNLLSL